MVAQDKKTDEVCICINLRNLNDAYMHDPFPTPFTDEVLEGVGVREMYPSQMDFRGTTRSGLQRRIAIRPCLSLIGDVFNIKLCLLGLRMHQQYFLG